MTGAGGETGSRCCSRRAVGAETLPKALPMSKTVAQQPNAAYRYVLRNLWGTEVVVEVVNLQSICISVEKCRVV